MIGSEAETEKVLKLHREEVELSRNQRVTGRVTVSTVTRTRDELIDELLTSEHVEMERVEIRQLVETEPAVRQEGDTTIIPILEEVVVVEKRLFLKEEVRIRRVQVTDRYQETVSLREQDVVINRSSETKPGDPSGS